MQRGANALTAISVVRADHVEVDEMIVRKIDGTIRCGYEKDCAEG